MPRSASLTAPEAVIPDPALVLQQRRRRWVLTGAAALVAVAVATTAVVVIARITAHSGTVVVNQPGQTTQPGRQPPPAVGAVVAATALYSDPVFLDPDDGYALAHTMSGGTLAERLVLSQDGGATWRVAGSSFPVEGQFTTILFTSLRTGYVFGPAGLMETGDGGRTWRQAPLAGEVQRVIPIPGGDTWAILNHCEGVPGSNPPCPVSVFVSTDGRSWHETKSPPPVEESALGGAVLARVGTDSGYLLTWGAPLSGLAVTRDNGASWRPVRDPCAGAGAGGGSDTASFGMQDMAAIGGGQLWLICGAAPTPLGQPKSVYRSSDGGSQWTLEASTGLAPGALQPVGHIPYQGDVSQLATVDPKIAWLGLGGVGVIETTDGGATWRSVDGVVLPPAGQAASPSSPVGVTFIRTDDGLIHDGWALAYGIGVWQTTDAVHWKKVSS